MERRESAHRVPPPLPVLGVDEIDDVSRHDLPAEAQVDAPLVDLGLGETRVVAEGPDKIGREVVVDIKTAGPLIIRSARGGLAPRVPDTVPVEAGVLAEGQPLALGPAGVDVEDIGVPRLL